MEPCVTLVRPLLLDADSLIEASRSRPAQPTFVPTSTAAHRPNLLVAPELLS